MNPNGNVAGVAGFRAYFSGQTSFRQWEGLFYQTGVAHRDFEREYAALRTAEGRMLPDAMVKTLPNVARRHPLHREWAVRRRSADALVRYLKKINPQRVLEIGCGNGWLTNFLASRLQADCCGVDINEIELKQAVRLFSTHDRVTFVYGDVMSEAFEDCRTDVIVCASVIQYFPDLRLLINHLKHLIHSGGEIHIIDSPLYHEGNASAARTRSMEHFTTSGHAAMATYYHHHTWGALDGNRCSVLHDPESLRGKIKRWLGFSPFPWVVVRP